MSPLEGPAFDQASVFFPEGRHLIRKELSAHSIAVAFNENKNYQRCSKFEWDYLITDIFLYYRLFYC